MAWVSSFEGSFYRGDLHHLTIPYYRHHRAIFAFGEDRNGGQWVGGDQAINLLFYDSAGRPSIVKDSAIFQPLKNKFITCIKTDPKNDNWVSTIGAGIFQYKNGSAVPTHFSHDPANPNSLSNDSVISLYFHGQNELWISSFSGLDQLNTQTGKFNHFQNVQGDSSSLRSNTIFQMASDKEGQLWIGTESGIEKHISSSGKFKHYLRDNTIVFLFKDSRDTLWACGAGLYYLDHTLDQWIAIKNPSDGKDFIRPIAMTEDADKNLWITTSSTIIRFNPTKYESSTYGKLMGVDGSNMSLFGAYYSKKGQLFFADTAGFYSFNPRQMQALTLKPEIQLAELRISNQLVEENGSEFLKEPLWKTSQIDLTYRQNVFSFDLGVIDYYQPDQNRLIYKLENYDEGWRIGGYEKRA